MEALYSAAFLVGDSAIPFTGCGALPSVERADLLGCCANLPGVDALVRFRAINACIRPERDDCRSVVGSAVDPEYSHGIGRYADKPI